MLYDRLSVASAYASVEGVRNVLDAATEHAKIERYCWILGLDDYFTHPKALELCRDLPASTLRVASFLRKKNCIFHPKVMLLSSSQKPDEALLLIGSANLTAAALNRNAEAVVLLHSETTAEAQQLLNLWEAVWKLGFSLTKPKLDDYRAKFEIAKQERKKLTKLHMNSAGDEETQNAEQIASGETELDASQATKCWIEVGKIVGGRELEFVAAQAPFFGLSSADNGAANRVFVLSNKSSVSLRLKYRPNAMWRLELTSQVPEVKAGLKIGMERSPYVAVVTKLNHNQFLLGFMPANSAEYAALRTESAIVGTLKKTSKRSYGWA